MRRYSDLLDFLKFHCTRVLITHNGIEDSFGQYQDLITVTAHVKGKTIQTSGRLYAVYSIISKAIGEQV